jgi:Methyltransferase domain
MLGGIANQILHPLGRHMERLHEGELAWNHSIVLNFPVELRPRWGYGASPNPFVQSVLDNARWRYKEVVEQIGAIWDTLLLIPDKIALGNDHQPYWDNDWFSGLDAVSLAAFLVARRPARYIEIGSGFSTKFCRWVVKHHNLDTRIISIDPHPRAEIDDLCDEIIRSPLEACDQSVFDQLEANDILFFDGSHRVLQNSDVTVFFLEVLPRLKPGVIIHVHDIFLPYDYPPAWTKRVYSEQYMLAATLVFGQNLEVLFPGYYVAIDPIFGKELGIIAQSSESASKILLGRHQTPAGRAASFWFTLKGR